MDETSALGREAMAALAAEVARGLAYAGSNSDSSSAFVVTPVLYANGAHVVCRIAATTNGFEVSDNGEGAIIADSMGLGGGFAKAAAYVSARAGAEYSHRTFYIQDVRREQLVGAVAYVANASAQAIERLIYIQDGERVSKTRSLFEDRIRNAFGMEALRNPEVRGATAIWKFDAVIRGHDGSVQTVFEFVSPQYSAVASSYMKLNNLRALAEGPKAIAVLADYNKTAPDLRSTLSLASDLVMSAEEPVETYLQAA